MPGPLDLSLLRRWPDVEAPGLVAADAADRLILDESAAARGGIGPGELVIIGDAYGALTLGASSDGAVDVRVHQDALSGEAALTANAQRWLPGARFTSMPLGADLVAGARVVLIRLPRSLDALADIAATVASAAAPDVVVFAGGRVKHMTLAMNDVLRGAFDRLDVTHARGKSRVLTARTPRAVDAPVPRAGREDGLEIRAYGGAFAGARIDIGTRLLLRHLPADTPGGTSDDPWIDFACGTGVVAAAWATRHPNVHVYASDQSAAAVASARATIAANGVTGRVVVARDDLLSARPDASASLVALNPPFHSGAAVSDRVAPRLFADAARVLRPGGELWCVWNSALRYRPVLERVVGPTRQIARDPKFTVTVSRRR
ncbi:class I SAM-dependent methyltransferase [Microbacterium imperiale]|uniref:16S RNA G1207 methylase RsmC n=1 Tax=Microbacterium imperiale TaxID=33884 RepID=A0A9W6HGG4_9MICO|nr:methyltransferase [Microbacterium imperiale]MBP2419169.1 16S rRNA (guanine1207-N2)-methyltransferase [Microbacterium imperiale]MDS0198957.1 methyltransferase [Microbacterium imperiale]BFE39511.1 methyltransferase [Microbacterium imperiale]GLJ80149.1 16S RNA G1207 methylase RsmC [Microbacterium imperiale]